MIKNTLKAVNEYAEARKQALEVFKQAESYITSNYIEGSAAFETAMRTARTAMNSAVDVVLTENKQTVMKDFEEARKAIQEVVATAPSQDAMNMISVINSGKLNQSEIQMILNQFKGNYIDSKMLHDAAGIYFENVEDLLAELDLIEKNIKDYFDGNGTGYKAELIKHGDWINHVDERTDDFINTYGV